MSTPESDERRWLLFPRPKRSPCSGVPGRGASAGSCVTCPTCQGSGRIPRELEKQLVALIPFGDQRLKPRRTKLFVSLAVLTCLVTTSLIIFFLFPRGITVHPAGLNSSTVAFDKTDVLLNTTGILNISNPNYWPITVSQLTVQVLHLSLVVGQLSKSLLLHVGPLASEQVCHPTLGRRSSGRSGGKGLPPPAELMTLAWQMFYTVASRITDESTYKICTWLEIKVHHVMLHIQATVTYSYVGRAEERVMESFEYVDCRGKTVPRHPVLDSRSAMAPT